LKAINGGKPMTLQQQLNEDLKSAMKAGDTRKRDTLRMVLSQMKYARIDNNRELTPDDELAVMMNAAKKRKEAIEMYQKGDRIDLLEKEQQELDIISAYLPKQLTDDEIATVVDEIIQKVGATTIKDMGKVMSAIMNELKGQVDGKKVQTLVRQKLG